MSRINYIATIFLILIFVLSCDRFYFPENDTKISEFGEDNSHYYGRNCMDCHYSAGPGEGWFTVAGSAEGNTNGAVIEIYKNENDPPILVVEFDKLSNAYTTEPIDFTGGLWVGLRSKSGELEMMDDKLFVGQCNLCHGATEEVLEID